MFRSSVRGGPCGVFTLSALTLALFAGPVTAVPDPAVPDPARTAPDPASGRADGALPGPDDLARARGDVLDQASAVAALEDELTRARADLDRLGIEAARAVEAYNGAQVRARQAAVAVQAARADVAEAGTAVERAHEDLGRLAAEAYRSGNAAGLGALGVLLSAKTPADAALRTETVRRMLRSREDTLRRSVDAAKHAEEVRRTADTAARRADAAADAVRAAQAAADAKVAEQLARVREFSARQDRLIGELAVARDTTVELERQRQEGRSEHTRRQTEEEARKRAEAAQTPAHSTADRPDAPSRPHGGKGDQAAPVRGGAAAAIAYAKAQLGKPYIWGGEGPHGYDCSGLVTQAWRRGGVELTHFAATQYAESRPVAYSELRPGDLVFWTETPRAEDIHHVAMYLGDGLMIHAPRTGDVIRVSSVFYMGTPDFYGRP